MLKPALQLRLGQQLTMTPQLQQAIRLLQLPVLELQAQIREALESNVMLEAEDEAGSLETGESTHEPEFEPTYESPAPSPEASASSEHNEHEHSEDRRETAEAEQPLDVVEDQDWSDSRGHGAGRIALVGR